MNLIQPRDRIAFHTQRPYEIIAIHDLVETLIGVGDDVNLERLVNGPPITGPRRDRNDDHKAPLVKGVSQVSRDTEKKY